MVQIYNEITIYFYKVIFASGASPPNPRWGPACPQTPQPGGWTSQRGYPPSALPRVEECTYFWGVNTSWGIDTAKRKDLCIRKIIRIHNQHSLPPLLACNFSPNIKPSSYPKVIQQDSQLVTHPKDCIKTVKKPIGKKLKGSVDVNFKNKRVGRLISRSI